VQLENLVDALVLLKEIECEYKHLAGRHNQKSHGHKIGNETKSSPGNISKDSGAYISVAPKGIWWGPVGGESRHSETPYFLNPSDWDEFSELRNKFSGTTESHSMQSDNEILTIARYSKDLLPGLYGVGRERFLALSVYSGEHASIVHHLAGGIKGRMGAIEDHAVRFRFGVGNDGKVNLLVFDLAYSGAEFPLEGPSLAARRNVEKTIGKLKIIGMVGNNTPTVIFGDRNPVLTTTKHLPGYHDQSRHAGSRAQATHPATGRILNAYKLPSQFKPISEADMRWSFGRTDEPYLKDERGFLIQGELVSPKDLPSTIYHVTTRADAVEQSGMLKGFAGLESGGLGGHNTEGVSLTSSREDAINIKRQMTRVIELAHTDEDLDVVLGNWAREDERISKIPVGQLDDAVSNAMNFYRINSQSSSYVGDTAALARLRIETGRSYRSAAAHRGAPQDVIIFGTDFSKLQPDDVQIFEVPKDALFVSGGAVLDKVAPGDFLHEVRVYGDVPMDDARIMRE